MCEGGGRGSYLGLVGTAAAAAVEGAGADAGTSLAVEALVVEALAVEAMVAVDWRRSGVRIWVAPPGI